MEFDGGHGTGTADDRTGSPDAVIGIAADRQARADQVLLRDLRHAIHFGALELHYQPQVGADGAVIGFEALARWPHPSRGTIGPDVFIPLAEQHGGIQALTEWTLSEACREAASWHFPLTVSVNISPEEFRNGDLAALVHTTLLRTGLAAARLELEITEKIMIEDFDLAISIVRRLRALGVRVVLDDFCKGYSSLSCLEAFPLTRLKVDRSFTANIGRKAESAAVVRSIIGLAHALGMEVTAEGVERQDQLDILLREGCDAMQGFLIGRPRDIATYAEMTGAQRLRKSA